jgi:hypothetical protein
MEKRVLDALKRVIEAEIDRGNYGMLSRARVDWDDVSLLARAGIEWRGTDTIKQNGIPVMRIVRRCAAKKSQGMYKELKPTYQAITIGEAIR